METKNYVRLTLSERIIIETLLGEKKTKSEIAQKLKRTRKTIGNEINRWIGDSSGQYRAELAHGYSKLINDYKRTKDKITLSKALKMQVYRGLLGHLSPEMISGRLRILYPDDSMMNISYETIYRYIYSHPQGSINRKLIKLLLHQKSRRRKSKRREGFSTKIREGISIDNRPQEVEERQEVGHWEGDLVIGTKQNSCIGTLVERKTRYAILLKLPNKKSHIVCKAFSRALNKHPEEFRKTMTYDNGTEMAEHTELTRETGMSVYFAHPYSSWERGTNENTNGLVRRFYPKKTDFNQVSEVELTKLQDHLNNRPRKVLGYYTPKEMYYFEKRKTESYDNDDLVLEMGNKSLKDLFSFLIPQRVQQIETRN